MGAKEKNNMEKTNEKVYAVTVNGKEKTDRLTIEQAESLFEKLSMRNKKVEIINVFSKRMIASSSR